MTFIFVRFNGELLGSLMGRMRMLVSWRQLICLEMEKSSTKKRCPLVGRVVVQGHHDEEADSLLVMERAMSHGATMSESWAWSAWREGEEGGDSTGL